MKQISTVVLALFMGRSVGQNAGFPALLDRYNAEKNFNGAVLVATNGKIDYLDGKGT